MNDYSDKDAKFIITGCLTLVGVAVFMVVCIYIAWNWGATAFFHVDPIGWKESIGMYFILYLVKSVISAIRGKGNI